MMESPDQEEEWERQNLGIRPTAVLNLDSHHFDGRELVAGFCHSGSVE